jgi:hypothetical protein
VRLIEMGPGYRKPSLFPPWQISNVCFSRSIPESCQSTSGQFGLSLPPPWYWRREFDTAAHSG